MPNLNKMRDISSQLGKNFSEIIKELYLERKMSSVEISDELFKITQIQITPRSIQRILRADGVTRSLSDAFNLAIDKGRKNYDHLRRVKKSSSLRKGIQPKLRYEVLKRDNFKCVLCGKTSIDDHLEIDHIIPVVGGGTNTIKNLRTLCSECNKGKMLLEERKIIIP